MDYYHTANSRLANEEQHEDIMNASYLEDDLSCLLALQPAFDEAVFGSSLGSEFGYVNIPTPTGSFDTMGSDIMGAMDDDADEDVDVSMFPTSTSDQSSPFWDFGGDEFEIHPEVFLQEGDGSLFDLIFDHIEPQELSIDGLNTKSQASTFFNSSSDIQYPTQISTSLKTSSWTPTASGVLEAYIPEYVAFTPSPSSLQGPNNSTSQAQAIATDHSHPHTPKSKKKSNSPSPSNKWIFISECQTSTSPLANRTGIRRGQLPAKSRRKARRIREIGACWKCWVQKVPCSEGAPCETCAKNFLAMAPEMCCRTRFHEYVPVFFPEYLHTHFEKRKVEDLITSNSNGFTGTPINICVTSGGAFEPMEILAHVFEPKTWELIGHYQLVVKEGQFSKLVERYSAPVGIMSLSRSEMRIECRKHIEDMVSNPHYAGQVTAGYKTSIPARILEIARNFDIETKGSSLVHEALMLHGIHYFMSSMLTLTEESKSEVYQQVEQIGAPPGEYLTSRLLNRQIKYVMNILHREIYHSVLEGLEKSLKSSSRRDSWGTSFCTLLLLSLCIEELQTAADTFVISDIRRKGDTSAHTRSESSDACIALEEHPFQQCTRLFHDVYRSRREVKIGGGGSRNGFNPFRALAGQIKCLDMNEATDGMTKAVYNLICNSQEEIAELVARSPTIGDGLEIELTGIKAHYTGRLAAKFLDSFLGDEETF